MELYASVALFCLFQDSDEAKDTHRFHEGFSLH